MSAEILLREGSRRTSRVEEEETLQGQKEGDEASHACWGGGTRKIDIGTEEGQSRKYMGTH